MKLVLSLLLIGLNALADAPKPTKAECELILAKSHRGSSTNLSQFPARTLTAKLAEGRIIDEKLGKAYGDLTVYAYWGHGGLSFGVEELSKSGEHSTAWTTVLPGAPAPQQLYYKEVGDQAIDLSFSCAVK
jgi:hypothetical protein